MTVAEWLNSMDENAAQRALNNCCASHTWVNGLISKLPFNDDEALDKVIASVNEQMQAEDWLEAFQAHPMIGDVNSLREKYSATKDVAAGEQSSVAMASDATLAELAELNRRYYDRFGFIFIVFATGKSADEMLAILRRRIRNTRDAELRNAAIEQMKISRLRMQKLAQGADDE